jgi:hypothetical protein
MPAQLCRCILLPFTQGPHQAACASCSSGIIHNVERPEDEHYKGLVSDLAERYMRRPGTVIVCTITCTADIDTQVGCAGPQCCVLCLEGPLALMLQCCVLVEGPALPACL